MSVQAGWPTNQGLITDRVKRMFLLTISRMLLGPNKPPTPLISGAFPGNIAISTCSPPVISTQYQWLQSTTQLSPIVLTSSWREWSFIFPFTVDSFLCTAHVLFHLTNWTCCQLQLRVYFYFLLFTMKARQQPLETCEQFIYIPNLQLSLSTPWRYVQLQSSLTRWRRVCIHIICKTKCAYISLAAV